MTTPSGEPQDARTQGGPPGDLPRTDPREGAATASGAAPEPAGGAWAGGTWPPPGQGQGDRPDGPARPGQPSSPQPGPHDDRGQQYGGQQYGGQRYGGQRYGGQQYGGQQYGGQQYGGQQYGGQQYGGQQYGGPPPTGGWGPPGYGPPPGWGPGPQQTETKAVVALVLAVGSFVVCPFVPAVIALVLARSSAATIAASGGRLTGTGLLKASRIIAWVNIGLCLLGGLALGLLVAVAGQSSLGMDPSTGALS